jgi:hypothetical protein
LGIPPDIGDWNRDIPKLSNKASSLMPLNVRKEIIYYNEMNDTTFNIHMNAWDGPGNAIEPISFGLFHGQRSLRAYI